MKRAVRVLQFADMVNRYDFIDNIIQYADPAQFEVGLCIRSEASNIGSPVYAERTPRWVIDGTSRRDWPSCVWQLARILRHWQADILHTHHYDQAMIGWLATRLSPQTKLVIGRHYSDSIYRLSSPHKKRALLGLEQACNRAAARIIVPSSYIREILTERQEIEPDKVDLIPYGFEPEKYVPPAPASVARVREEFALEGRLALGTFARLHEEKGHRFLLGAIKNLRECLPDIRLVIVGEGAERAAIEHQIRLQRLEEHVCLAGWRRDGMTIMAAMDIVVQPTLQEAFSQVMVEALWMCKPLIITDVSGASDIIRRGDNGMIVPKGDSEALGAAIWQLARDPALRSRLGETGRAYVEEHLTIDKIIGRYERSYFRLARKAGDG